MEKIIQINYQGRNLSIEENAYAAFQQYENELKNYFKNEEAGDEVIIDLQDRIAEILDLKLNAGSSAITLIDIEEVMNIIGRPSDLSDAPKETINSNSFAEKKKLYRDSAKPGKFIAGVCSGIANYFAIDPLAVRLLFILFTFMGAIQFFSFNIGIIGYIILWIVLPAKELKDTVTKKLFRNPMDKVLGGVCGGVSHFFNVEVWVVRLLFLLPLLLNAFTSNWLFAGQRSHLLGISAGSFMFLTYLVLWLIVPLAKSSTDYMLLKGEPINISTIQNPLAVNVVKQASSSGTNSFLKVVAYILLAAFIMSLIPMGAGALFLSIFTFKLSDIILFSALNKTLALLALLFGLALPFVWLITGLIRRLAGFKPNKFLRATYLTLHVVGWVAAFALVTNLVRTNNTMVSKDAKFVINTKQDTLFVKALDSNKTVESNVIFDLNQVSNLVHTEGSKHYINGVRLKYKPTDEPDFFVEVEKTSFGTDKTEADANIYNIQYESLVKDNVLFLPAVLGVSRFQPYHFQNVKVTIYVPRNKTLLVTKEYRKAISKSLRIDKKNFNINFDEKNPKNDLIYSRGLENVIRIDDNLNESTEAQLEIEEKKREAEDKIREAKRRFEDAKLEAERELRAAQRDLERILGDSVK